MFTANTITAHGDWSTLTGSLGRRELGVDVVEGGSTDDVEYGASEGQRAPLPRHLSLHTNEIGYTGHTGYTHGAHVQPLSLSAEDAAKLAITNIYSAVSTAHNTR